MWSFKRGLQHQHETPETWGSQGKVEPSEAEPQEAETWRNSTPGDLQLIKNREIGLIWMQTEPQEKSWRHRYKNRRKEGAVGKTERIQLAENHIQNPFEVFLRKWQGCNQKSRWGFESHGYQQNYHIINKYLAINKDFFYMAPLFHKSMYKIIWSNVAIRLFFIVDGSH